MSRSLSISARGRRRFLAQGLRGLILACGCLAFVRGGAVDSPARHSFDLPADEVERALKRFSAQSGRQVIFPTDLVKGLRTAAVRGQFTALEALTRMLENTKLVAALDVRTGAFAITRQSSSPRRPAKPSGGS